MNLKKKTKREIGKKKREHVLMCIIGYTVNKWMGKNKIETEKCPFLEINLVIQYKAAQQ